MLVAHLRHVAAVAVLRGGGRLVFNVPVFVVGLGSVVISPRLIVVSLRLHASVPAVHVCSNESSDPHFLNQAPPRAQQLSMPDGRKMAHLGHFTGFLT